MKSRHQAGVLLLTILLVLFTLPVQAESIKKNYTYQHQGVTEITPNAFQVQFLFNGTMTDYPTKKINIFQLQQMEENTPIGEPFWSYCYELGRATHVGVIMVNGELLAPDYLNDPEVAQKARYILLNAPAAPNSSQITAVQAAIWTVVSSAEYFAWQDLGAQGEYERMMEEIEAGAWREEKYQEPYNQIPQIDISAGRLEETDNGKLRLPIAVYQTNWGEKGVPPVTGAIQFTLTGEDVELLGKASQETVYLDETGKTTVFLYPQAQQGEFAIFAEAIEYYSYQAELGLTVPENVKASQPVCSVSTILERPAAKTIGQWETESGPPATSTDKPATPTDETNKETTENEEEFSKNPDPADGSETEDSTLPLPEEVIDTPLDIPGGPGDARPPEELIPLPEDVPLGVPQTGKAGGVPWPGYFILAIVLRGFHNTNSHLKTLH